MSASVFAFLAQVKERGAQLPQPLAAALLLAAVRLSDKNGQAVRPDLLVVDDDGGLTLRKGSPDREGPYSAPELAGDKISPRDPRVLVYAAGALGYELCTLETPQPGATTDGPLGPIIQKALSKERKERYKTLEEMAQAIQELQRRPTNDEERLILNAVVQSTAAPKSVAKVATRKMQAFYALGPEDGPDADQDEPAETPSPGAKKSASVHGWDPHDRTPRVVFPKEPPAAAAAPSKAPSQPPRLEKAPDAPAAQATAAAAGSGAPQPQVSAILEQVRAITAELQADRKSRGEEFALLDSRIDAVARLAERIDALEKRPSAPLTPRRREPKELLDQRRFADAERLLRDASEDDAGQQLLLGMAIAGQPDPDGSRAPRAEAAFRRASELDTSWAQPKALLGALLVRQGRRAEAIPILNAALALDPDNPTASSAFAVRRPRPVSWPAAVLGTVGGAAAALVVALSARPAPTRTPPPPENTSAIADAAPAPKAAPASTPVVTSSISPAILPLPPPAEPARADPPSVTAARPEKPSRPRKVASADSGKRSEALAETAKGEKALRAFDTASAVAAFKAALRLDPRLASAHRGMGMVNVLQGKDAEAKAEYRRYLELAPDAPDREQIQRLLSR